MAVKEIKQSTITKIIRDLQSFYAEKKSQADFPFMPYSEAPFGQSVLYFFSYSEEENAVYGVAVPDLDSKEPYAERFRKATEDNQFLFFILQDKDEDSYEIRIVQQEKNDENNLLFEYFKKKIDY